MLISFAIMVVTFAIGVCAGVIYSGRVRDKEDRSDAIETTAIINGYLAHQNFLMRRMRELKKELHDNRSVLLLYHLKRSKEE